MSEITETTKQRVIAIVGRPNVGKSAIFNRLAGRRIAIVHAQSGVTRDRLMHEVIWHDEHFELIDTGGIGTIESAAADSIDGGIRIQVNAALEDAAVAMLVVNLEDGVVPLDEEVAAILRKSGCPAFVAVNKADNQKRDAAAVDFEQLGLPVFPVSALHDRGFGELMEAMIPELPPPVVQEEKDALRVAVVGRPNVGKSSYINRLLRSDRVIVSEVPGTTRDSIDVPFSVGSGPQARHYVLVDTAGMRRVGKIDNSVERFSRFRAEKSIKEADVVVVLTDAGTDPTAMDKKIAAAVIRENKGCVVIVNKWDLATTTQRQFAPEVKRIMPFMGHCPLVFASAKTGYNIRRTVEAIDHVAAQVSTTLPTGVLNRVLEASYAKVSPPSVRGKRLKLYYATQVSHSPIIIRIFCNDPKRIVPAYRAYLVRTLRSHFGLEGAPVLLQFRGRQRPN
ncbi:MAG: ribosome biogenesis GTPase Der [Kiritimatiellae bacterium]|nr:ribosome biogenesis GTPase Der [Kiritimatiellia bacterium]